MNGMYEHLLRQGVEAHNAGDFNKARGIYGAILTQDPSHPDASHNLGVLEISSNNMPDALPLLKRASDSRPDVAKFWFTYIDVLISVKDFKTAKRALKKVKNKGLFDESFKVLAKKLTKPSQTTLNAELEKLPVQADVEELMLQYANGHYDLACEQALSIIKNWPNHCLSWKILSSIYAQTAKLDEAFWAIQNAIKVDPDDVETHNISANILNDMGKHRDAEIC
ncbi:MAG: tetratricopeptide repeat protein, partial [Porticoccaceae bacterium]|nr:tetratricopeptide repeat protein [Porticoccaceae bacterium]